MTGAEALQQALAALRAAGIEDPAGDARRLLAFAAGIDPSRLVLAMHDPIDAVAAARFEELIVKRAQRAPVSHLVGGRDFYGRRFVVTGDVLDPRPDTETLIEQALSVPFARVLDLGTGSGCILLTLLAERVGATGIGADMSEAALSVAQQNAESLQLTDRTSFVTSDWFSAVPEGRFDLIVSNPPYIDADEIPGLAPEVRLYEPMMALSPGADGTAPYRVIAEGAKQHLIQGGHLMVEIGHRQGDAVAQIFAEAGFANVQVIQDLNAKDRVVRAIIR
ncbi:peptide chain release factor N(5)-glutamine methyltransferase [Donghicola tyrosinivorans]|uniref:Release factor glutamine methyltransferase n=1 Tax=Donghicola tyrosinivorans TaxID=1652492 RepID=A0A2T0X5P5_9RHOB|nr:peptide chain release factor N(5)-glutamine methyltransferase [Donghicola tyrosinivorans]PRY94194.1 release factor glutamine methyltransferase [Donghicola tyrosinivorans]